MARKTVTASFVRAWAAENGIETGKRGRLHPDVLDAFHKANKGKVYTVGHKEPKTVTVQVETRDKNGRKRTKNSTVTIGEARVLVGAEGKRGRISAKALAEALASK